MTAAALPFAPAMPHVVQRAFAYKWPIAFGGSIGIAIVATQLTTGTAQHRATLVEHVTEDARLAELSAGWYDMVDATAANAAPARAQDPDVVNGGGPSHRARWSLQSHQGRVAAS